ncbi:MAG: carboxypeptidase-like regulatory domain-containing protein [Bacteroidales bacterium]|jgi:hypothetical protein|nr:carboxypeptidase-like regulatory domain-containing protein [Bacteroidales bacterium]MDD4213351.1 carboxypeptidase-like regulatory domain-containing protein [Bacteroidales bacterium]
MPLKPKRFIASLIVVFFLCNITKGYSQINDTTLVQFSGIVLTDDSLTPIPFVNILVKDSWRGTITDLYGFFSFVAKPKDVVVFNALGYKTVYYTIPDTLSVNRYSLIQVMRQDTLILNETVIYPWPTYEQFKKAFIKLDIPDDELARAQKNITEIKERIINEDLEMNSGMNFRNYIDRRVSQLYFAGQPQPNPLLNVFAWEQFFKAWKDGKFKVKKTD